jgi:anthranilate phosphoribosyltransferase
MIKEGIKKVIEGMDLSTAEIETIMNEIMTGQATEAQIGSFLTGLRIKGETADEIAGAARVMRKHATGIRVDDDIVVDTCGTGGDGAHTFNISTVAAFVAAGAGLKVAKHGNRSVSSRCGSADVLEHFGVKLDIAPKRVEECIKEVGIGFLFAPLLHGAMKYAIGPRREMGVRTIFNILGPLTNPAGANAQVLGVYDEKLTGLLAYVLKNLGCRRAFVVHGSDGLDEITLTGVTRVSELKEDEVRSYSINPQNFGFKTVSAGDLAGGDVKKNSEILLAVLKGEAGPPRDVVLLNAGAAIVAGGKATNLNEGIEAAGRSIDSGKALKKLEMLKEYTNK